MCLLLLLFEVPSSFRCHLGFAWQVRHSVDSCVIATPTRKTNFKVSSIYFMSIREKLEYFQNKIISITFYTKNTFLTKERMVGGGMQHINRICQRHCQQHGSKPDKVGLCWPLRNFVGGGGSRVEPNLTTVLTVGNCGLFRH